MSRRKNRFLSCVMVIASAAVLIQLSLGSATETQRGIEEIVNEYLFTAGNDSTGAAAITYASRLHPYLPVSHRFENFSFPDSCASHPSRCRVLTYRQPNNLIFYVPLTEHLGIMEFSDNGTTLSHVQTRIVDVGKRCDPISIMDITGTLYLICVSDRDRFMSCKLRNPDIVQSVWLDCTTPSVQVDTSLLSNFIVYGDRNPDIYFTYGNAMYRRVITSNYNEFLATLLPDYSHCRHIELVQHPEPMIAAYCYLHSSNDNIQVVYFHLNEHHFQEQINATTFVKYDCPSQGTFVEVTSHGAYASYWENNSYIGSFNIIGNSVTFGTCFKFQNATHFVYRDRQLGTFIKPNISVDLRSGVDQLSAGPCQSPACEQPVVFKNQYVLALHQNARDWTQKLFDIQRGTGFSILEFNVRDAAQVALISDLVTYPEPTTPTPVSPKANGDGNDKSITITSTTVSVGGLLFLIVIALPLLIMVFYRNRNHKTCLHRGEGQSRGTYTSVCDERNSRQGSPDSPGDMELELLTEGEEQQPTAMTNPRAIRTNEHEADSVISRQSSGSDINPSPRAPLDREDFTALGSSRDVVAHSSLQSSPQLTQQISTATVTGTHVEQQHGTEQSPELQTHHTSSSPPNMRNDPVPLQSQRSHDSTRSASSNHGDATLAPPSTLPQALRPVSLVTGPLSNGQATTSTPPLSPNRAPVRYNSNESSASDGTSNSGCRSTDLRTNRNSGSMSSSPTAAVPPSSSIQSIARNDRELATVELPLNRDGYQGVGASQEDVQRPNPCTQPHSQGCGAAGDVATPMTSYGSGSGPTTPLYSRQHSYDSSTGSVVPNNDVAASRSRMRPRPRNQHSPLSSLPIQLHAHSPNQPPGHTVSSPTSNQMPNVFTHRSLSSESDTSQISNTPSVNQGHPSFFSSDLNSDNTILPPHSENLSSAHLATGTHCSSRMVPPNFHRLNSNDSGHT